MTDQEKVTGPAETAQALADAGTAAAAGERTPEAAKAKAKTAIRERAKAADPRWSEDEVNMLADALADAVIDRMGQRGAFEEPPEQVTAPAPDPASVAGPASAPAVEAPAAPRTFAERFRGRR